MEDPETKEIFILIAVHRIGTKQSKLLIIGLKGD